MKRVFEGIVFERRRIGDNAIGACTTEAFEEFYQSLPIGKATRITAEDLPESKPEKNCGNCSNPGCGGPVERGFCGAWMGPKNKSCANCGFSGLDEIEMICKRPKNMACDSYCAWIPMQPKPAEPQGWEQRLKAQFPDAYGGGPLMAFIRAEIERVREKSEHEVCIARQEGYVRGLKEAREQNKHRECGE